MSKLDLTQTATKVFRMPAYLGDGTGLSATVDDKTQTVAEWITALSSGGSGGKDGVGIVSITASQDTIIVGQLSKVTLTALLTDGTTSVTTFEAPPGADGAKGDTGAAGATGPQGETGATGATGPQGEAGAAGPQGAAGEQGATGATGASLKSITATQGTVTPGEASTVTLTGTLTDDSTVPAGTFTAPAGATGKDGATGPAGATGATGADGVGIASVAVTQGAVTAGQPTTVTLTATMTNGVTAPGVSFESPAGAAGAAGATGATGATGPAGSDANVTTANIETALGYTPANGDDYLPISGGTMTGGLTLPGSIGLTIKDGSGAYIYTEWSYGNLQWIGGSGQGAFQWPGTIQTAAFAFASLPSSPKDWCFAIVTDKAIGSGSQGVMAMYNPNTKTWTGLSGEALV